MGPDSMGTNKDYNHIGPKRWKRKAKQTATSLRQLKKPRKHPSQDGDTDLENQTSQKI